MNKRKIFKKNKKYKGGQNNLTNNSSSNSSISTNISSSMSSGLPTSIPSNITKSIPTSLPTSIPTNISSSMPSGLPTSIPTNISSSMPSGLPTSIPKNISSSMPSGLPTSIPKNISSSMPSGLPTSISSGLPTSLPSGLPTSISSNMGIEGGMEQMGLNNEKLSQIKGMFSLFAIFDDNNLYNIIQNVYKVDSERFERKFRKDMNMFKELDETKMKTFDLIYCKKIASYMLWNFWSDDYKQFIHNVECMDEKKDDKKSIFGKIFKKYKCKKKKQIFFLSKKIDLDKYAVKQIARIFYHLTDDFFTLIRKLLNKMEDLKQRSIQNGIQPPEDFILPEDTKMIGLFILILDQFSIWNLDRILDLARKTFKIEIPSSIGGGKLKLIIKALKIIFPYDENAKLKSLKTNLSNEAKDELRTTYSVRNMRNSKQTSFSQFVSKIRDEKYSKQIMEFPFTKNNEIDESLRGDYKIIPLLLLMMLQTYYVTHIPKNPDKDEFKKWISKKKNSKMYISSVRSYDDLKNIVRGYGINIYELYIYQKSMIFMCIKYMLEHYKDNNVKSYYNVYFHFLYSFFNNELIFSFFNKEFNFNHYFDDMKESLEKNGNNRSGELLVEYNNNLIKMLFGNEIDIKSKYDFYTIIFNKTFEKNPELLKFFDFKNGLNSSTFGGYLENMIENKVKIYIANTFYNNIELLRYGRNINLSKPTYYSIHQIKFGKNGLLNQVIMNTVLNENNKKQPENDVISKNKLNKLIKNVRKEIYDTNGLEVQIKEINKLISNSEPLQKKMQELYLFEILLMLLYKRYSKTIDYEITSILSKQLDIQLEPNTKINFVKEYLPSI